MQVSRSSARPLHEQAARSGPGLEPLLLQQLPLEKDGPHEEAHPQVRLDEVYMRLAPDHRVHARPLFIALLVKVHLHARDPRLQRPVPQLGRQSLHHAHVLLALALILEGAGAAVDARRVQRHVAVLHGGAEDDVLELGQPALHGQPVQEAVLHARRVGEGELVQAAHVLAVLQHPQAAVKEAVGGVEVAEVRPADGHVEPQVAVVRLQPRVLQRGADDQVADGVPHKAQLPQDLAPPDHRVVELRQVLRHLLSQARPHAVDAVQRLALVGLAHQARQPRLPHLHVVAHQPQVGAEALKSVHEDRDVDLARRPAAGGEHRREGRGPAVRQQRHLHGRGPAGVDADHGVGMRPPVDPLVLQPRLQQVHQAAQLLAVRGLGVVVLDGQRVAGGAGGIQLLLRHSVHGAVVPLGGHADRDLRDAG
mmetsp:Transcript_26679/g.67120  ORF Transcript_26679/g.67120 Transcript_26679/m.67120 type:complete len:422 (+) Transcript_26679:84-1349(+)